MRRSLLVGVVLAADAERSGESGLFNTLSDTAKQSGTYTVKLTAVSEKCEGVVSLVDYVAR